jgi:hypothetical protein
MSKAAELIADIPDESTITEEEIEAYKQLLVEKISLPSFYTFDERPDLFKINILPDDAHAYRVEVTDEAGNVVDITDPYDVVSAYEYVDHELKKDLVFTGHVYLIPSNENRKKNNNPSVDLSNVIYRGMVTVPSTGKNVRALLTSPHDTKVWLAVTHYYRFLKLTVEYEKNPNDFVTAYNWVDYHPAFWTRYTADSNHWNIANNSKVWVGVGVHEDSRKPYIMLEHGAAVPDERTSTYHDLRLDVYEDTYEEAFIALAAKVHKFFDVDGSERPDVDYKKSNLEKLLEEAVADLDE